MKLQPGNVAEESSTPQNSLPQSDAGRERDQQSANGDGSNVTEAPQSCWWEAGWFKEWERSAQPAQKRSA
jgi:hypothetical protein